MPIERFRLGRRYARLNLGGGGSIPFFLASGYTSHKPGVIYKWIRYPARSYPPVCDYQGDVEGR